MTLAREPLNQVPPHDTSSAAPKGPGNREIPKRILAVVALGLAALAGVGVVVQDRPRMGPDKKAQLAQFATYADVPDWLSKRRTEPGRVVAPGVKEGHFSTAWEVWPTLDPQTRKCVQALSIPENDLGFF